ncbi:tRNA lysidine(34) synthetase TilS [Cohnella sp. AR92]|nr:tRNA lysidine(34) synthetase TilS [Cohnella sp. AR92]
MVTMDELLLRFEAWTRGEKWRSPGAAVAAAVSGGPDSMALLHLLKLLSEKEGFSVIAVHVNHRFRGEESDAEEELVRRTARDWGIPFESSAIDMPAYIEQSGMNPQEASRERRYGFLVEAARKHEAAYIALAHHADDQAETVLMRILRGTGLQGLAGIAYSRSEKELELIRPLLRIPKCELLKYASRNGILYAVDSSNLKKKYFRNAVRLDVLPFLEGYNPKIKEALLRLSETAAVDNDYMEREALQAFAESVTRAGEGWTLDRRRFCGLHVALQRRLIKLILNYAKPQAQILDYDGVTEAVAAIASEQAATGRLDMGNGWVLVREYDRVYMGPRPQAPGDFEYQVREPDSPLRIPEARAVLRFHREIAACRSPSEYLGEAYFDESELLLPLTVRNRRPGDRFEPSGLNGSKKVQDMFVDAKIPRSLRDAVPLLADARGNILWIPGVRRSRHALPEKGKESKLLRISIEMEN